jgi:hypothetical protein
LGAKQRDSDAQRKRLFDEAHEMGTPAFENEALIRMSQEDDSVREHLLWQLRGGQAHMSLKQAIANYPMDRINEKFPNGAYGAWALVEHMRRGQWDILDFIRNPGYVYIKWPDDYWPAVDYVATDADWDETVAAFERDAAELEALVEDPNTDLYAKIPHGTGQTILREILLVCDHNAYHLGEFAIMRQVMGTWYEDRKTP